MRVIVGSEVDEGGYALNEGISKWGPFGRQKRSFYARMYMADVSRSSDGSQYTPIFEISLLDASVETRDCNPC